jgi:hypothetical protein
MHAKIEKVGMHYYEDPKIDSFLRDIMKTNQNVDAIF